MKSFILRIVPVFSLSFRPFITEISSIGPPLPRNTVLAEVFELKKTSSRIRIKNLPRLNEILID
ncbi:MAG: hypothetical protein ABIJ56_12025 [Pseudomonadota bacterium]